MKKECVEFHLVSRSDKYVMLCGDDGPVVFFLWADEKDLIRKEIAARAQELEKSNLTLAVCGRCLGAYFKWQGQASGNAVPAEWPAPPEETP